MQHSHDVVPTRRSALVRRIAITTAIFAGSALPAVAGTSSRVSGEGIASFYGRSEHGGPTASGERFDMNALTAAHRTAPLGSHLKVTNTRNGRSVVVRVNDRGPFVRGRIIDLSRAAADRLGFVASGLTRVQVETAAADEVATPTRVASLEPATTGTVPTPRGAARRTAPVVADASPPLSDAERMVLARN